MNNLEKNILSTIVYYDILDYPLTSFEVWKYLTISDKQGAVASKCDLFDVVKALEGEAVRKHVSFARGFYFIKGRDSLAGERIERSKISARKMKIIKRIVSVLRFVPFVRMAAVTGRVAMKNAKSKSDLDFLIVIEKGKIFTGRLLVTLVTHLLGRRRYGKKITDRACLNYYITTSSLGVDFRDIYSANEYTFIFPIFGREVFKRFQKENIWVINFKPNFAADSVLNMAEISESFWNREIRKTLEEFLRFNIIENTLKNKQTERIMKDPRTHQKDSAVMASDASLVFLPDPHGPKIYEKFRKALDRMRL